MPLRARRSLVIVALVIAGDLLFPLSPAAALPIVLTGDFNTTAQSGGYVYNLLVGQAGYRDTWTTAALRGPAYGTFHNYQPLVANGPRIDWVLTTPASPRWRR